MQGGKSSNQVKNKPDLNQNIAFSLYRHCDPHDKESKNRVVSNGTVGFLVSMSETKRKAMRTYADASVDRRNAINNPSIWSQTDESHR